MAYAIEYTYDADGDLRYLGRTAESAIRKAVLKHLCDRPGVEEGRRKRLDPNPLAAPWELRLGVYRVFYDVDEVVQEVLVLRVGHKPAETLYLRGKPVVMRVD